MKPVEPSTLFLAEDPEMPNNPALPVLVYRGVVDREAGPGDRVFQRRFSESGWRGIWRNGIFGYHHFHPDAHEALGIARGAVSVQIGGESGERLQLQAGDLVVLPAGAGHRNLSSTDDLLVIGAYPAGQERYTTCREPVDRDVVSRVPRPANDPFYGANGPLVRLWAVAAT